jgi:HEPN domain-containing protein
MNKTAQKWFKQGLHDLENAKKNFEIKAYDVTLFLYEQSIEKVLKGYYYQKFRKSPPRIHSLEKLAELVNLSKELDEFVIELDDYYLALRYPDAGERMPYELCEREDAKRGLEIAEKLIENLSKKLRRHKENEEGNKR